ncbi:MAG: N-6 DNA methylase, partial [bacterium]
NDLLEALIALPEQLFYNTGIATYVWVLSNRKPAARRGQVLLIDATSFWTPMRKSLGDKRREIPAARAGEILSLLAAFAEGPHCKLFPTTHFGYRKITVERPLRLNFQVSAARLARLDEQSGFANLAACKKKDAKARADDEAKGRAEQDAIRALLRTLPDTLFSDRAPFIAALQTAATRASRKLAAPILKAILAALGERDESAAICRDADGQPEPDPELRDTESVPLSEPVDAYFAREVAPYVPDAWNNTSVRDDKDGQIGKVGYEINFNRYFYVYTPPRPLQEIQADIKALEQDILTLLREVAG